MGVSQLKRKRITRLIVGNELVKKNVSCRRALRHNGGGEDEVVNSGNDMLGTIQAMCRGAKRQFKMSRGEGEKVKQNSFFDTKRGQPTSRRFVCIRLTTNEPVLGRLPGISWLPPRKQWNPRVMSSIVTVKNMVLVLDSGIPASRVGRTGISHGSTGSNRSGTGACTRSGVLFLMPGQGFEGNWLEWRG